VKLAQRAQIYGSSATMAFAGRAAELRRAGRDIVSLAAGEPDFPTPPHVVEAMVEAARGGATRYPPPLGLPALREAVAKRASARYGVALAPTQVVVTPGAKLALWAAFQLLVDPGDEVLVPAPCWVSYAPQIAHAGGRMVPVPMAAEDGFRLCVDALRRALTARTVGVVLNLPNNPTGALASHEAMRALGDLALERDLWIVSDDIYAELRFAGGAYPSPLSRRPELAERVVVIDGLSKSHAMTGWRVGYAIAPQPMVSSLGALIGQTVTGVTTFAQHGAIAALEGDSGFLTDWVDAYRRRSERVTARLAAIGLAATRPEGAFYALADVRSQLDRGGAGRHEHDVAWATRLLEHGGVAVVPGSPFLAPGHVRLSYACSDERLEEGLDRIARFVGTG
jgi:aspartate aminotransferase